MAHMTRRTLGFYRDTSSPVLADMRQIMDEVLEIYAGKLQSRAIKVQREYQPHSEVTVFPGEMPNPCSNLIANAIDAIRRQGTIIIRVRSSHSWNHSALPGARVTVADSGTGITPADKQKIFEPFYTTKKETGTGLGLWLSKDIVQNIAAPYPFAVEIVARSSLFSFPRNLCPFLPGLTATDGWRSLSRSRITSLRVSSPETRIPDWPSRPIPA